MSNYSIKKNVDMDYEEALEKVKDELKKEGFGVLTELNMKNIFKEKIDKELNKYTLLGACHPEYAYEGIKLEKELGLLLPCNVIVYVDDSDNTIVATIDPMKSLGLTNNEDIDPVGEEIFNRLTNVIESM